MRISRFTSEAYPVATRGNAWRELLDLLRLDSDWAADAADTFAAGILRGDRDAIALARFAAGPQTLSPLPSGSRSILGVVPLDETLEVEAPRQDFLVDAGCLCLLPMDGQWQLKLTGYSRFIAVRIGESLMRGGLPGARATSNPTSRAAEGMAAVFIDLVVKASASMQELEDREWRALERAVTELFLTIAIEKDEAEGGKAPGTAALFHRVTLAIERRLHEPELTPRRIARAEGISERYLQKLFEQNGESFSQHLRERRLQRAHLALTSPAEMRTSVAEVAFNAGFGDAANFSRLFKERFGMPPGAFRARYSEKLAEAGSVEQRGWPLQVLENKRLHRSNPLDGDPLVEPVKPAGESSRHHLVANAANIHWGYFSQALRPVLEIDSGDWVVVETLSQHSSDAPDIMITGDAAAEEVFHWTSEEKTVDRRGAGPLDASVFGRGAGEGFGVHICTGPIYVRDAEPGDVVEVRIEDMTPRPSRSPGYEGRCFGSNVAAWWGYQYNELIQSPKPRENVTIYEIFPDEDGGGYAEALLSYRWSEQVDPFGVTHKTYDYPGVPIDRSRAEVTKPLKGVRIPLRPHFGVIALAPREPGLVDSVPPAYFGGNLDNWRLGKGSSVYLPVSVPGGLLSIGDPHAAQGDGELSGTAIECSMTGCVSVVLHKKGTLFADLDGPLIETADAWVLTGFSHPNYLAEFGAKGQGEVYAKSSLDLAMKDAFRKTRRFLISSHGLNEDEAISVISAAVDFGVTQVVDGNWGVHAVVKKSLFAPEHSPVGARPA